MSSLCGVGIKIPQRYFSAAGTDLTIRKPVPKCSGTPTKATTHFAIKQQPQAHIKNNNKVAYETALKCPGMTSVKSGIKSN